MAARRSKSLWRRNNIGRRLNEAVKLFEARIIENLRANGHGTLGLAHINLTRNLDEQGTRLTELARRASMTKQSMGELVDQVEQAGLVRKKRDPTDGRAKLVCFTAKGLLWLEAFHRSLDHAEAEMRDQVGAAEWELVMKVLTRYVESADTG